MYAQEAGRIESVFMCRNVVALHASCVDVTVEVNGSCIVVKHVAERVRAMLLED